MRRRELIIASLAYGVLAIAPRAARAQSISSDKGGPAFPAAQVKRIMEALRLCGEPLPATEAAQLLALSEHPSGFSATEIERILERHTLLRVQLDPYGIGTASRGGAGLQLRELGWRSFLVRVENPARLTGPLALFSRAAIPEGELQPGIHESHILGNDLPEIVHVGPDAATDYDRDVTQWMGYRFGVGMLPDKGLDGAPLEYLILQLYSQLGGVNAAPLWLGSASRQRSSRHFDTQGLIAEFVCEPASTVALKIRDWDGGGTMVSLLIRDECGRLYPAPAHRLEPDLGYQPHVYRADGETIRLPAGRYSVSARRGPEYLECHRDLVVASNGTPSELAIDLERWIHPAQLGWYPGDPHLHPEGQVYGIVSKYGLTPETLLRQVRGEGLSIGSILIWAGGYYYEKQFLTGHVYQPTYTLPFPKAQHANNSSFMPRPTPHDAETLIRYDVEQAAFPSNRLGHPVLLRLKNHDFPGARSIYDWPSWNLPVLQWARAQGAVVGYAHIGHRMSGTSSGLPNYEIPALEDLGANECLVDVTHGAVDFLAGGQNRPVGELNVWYHLLNCGFRIPMIGETDFWGQNALVGATRTYVKLDSKPVGDAGYGAWVEGIKAGCLYFGDGRSHLIDFRANGRAAGEGALELRRPDHVVLSARIAARLDPTPIDVETELRRQNLYSYWHIERARIESTRKVPLEVIVNGQVVERREVLADGDLRTLSIQVDVARSSWVALRILPSAHTAPIFVSVGGQTARASRRSAQWCLDCVNVLWDKHAKRIRESERAAAAAAWDHARDTYRRIMSECELD